MTTQLPGFDEVEQIADEPLPERIGVMHRMYGTTEGERCRTCAHLYRKHWDKSYYKCDLNRDTNGAATDWRTRWPACGRWERRP